MAFDVFDLTNGGHSFFFIGGRGVGIVQPGGCLKSWWDTKVAAVGEASALAALMTPTGAAIDTMSFASGGNSGATFFRITAAGEFTNTEAGMVAYCDSQFGNVPDGYYEIMGVDPGGDWIDIKLTWTIDDDFNSVTVGGAFNDFQTANDEVDAMEQNVTVFDNLGDSNRTATLDVPVGGNERGSTHLRFVGYGTIPSDGIKVVYDFDGVDPSIQNGLYIWPKSADLHNLIFENYHVTGVGDGLNYRRNLYVKPLTYDVVGLAFYRCDFSNADPGKVGIKGINVTWAYESSTAMIVAIMVGCKIYGGSSEGVEVTSLSNIQYGHIAYVDCQIYNNDGNGIYGRGSTLVNSAVYNNGGIGILAANQGLFVINSMSVNNGDSGFKKAGAINHGFLVNSIISNNTNSAIFQQGADGSLTTYNTTLIGTIPSTVDTHYTDNLTDDPRLADPANGDLRILNTKRKRLGMTDIHGNIGQHGPPTNTIASRADAGNSLVNQFTT